MSRPPHFSLVLLAMVFLVVVACNQPASSSFPTATALTTTTASETFRSTTTVQLTTTVMSPPDSGEFEIADEFIDFVAAIDELLLDTNYEGLVEEDPEIFIVTGLLFCEQLSEGVIPSEILIFYVETLTGDHIDEVDDDALVLAGSILGTAVGYFCPEHTDTLEEGL